MALDIFSGSLHSALRIFAVVAAQWRSGRDDKGFILVVVTHRVIIPVTHSPSAPHGVIAMTRSGLPEPFTILSGAAITTAPVAGS